MESTTAPLARTAPTAGLAELVQRPGPFLTAALETEPAIDNAAHRSAQRWKVQRDAACDRGVPEQAMVAIDDLLHDAHLHGAGLYVVADGERGEPWLVEHLAAVPQPGPFVRWAPLPSLVPLLADRQARLPHVVVRADREGADLLAVDATGDAEPQEVGDDRRQHPYRHARSVGWRELRGWHRAQRHLEATAEGIAAAAADAAARVGAGLVAVTGDDRTVNEVVERLSARGLDSRRVAGGRGHDGSVEQVDLEVETLVRTVVAEHTVAALERFREQLAHGLAVQGLDATRRSLGNGQVDVLLVHDDGGPDRAVDELVRRALDTSAGVLVVPAHGGPDRGIGGLLRWK